MQDRADVFRARARTATDEERKTLWPIMTAEWPAYDEYRQGPPGRSRWSCSSASSAVYRHRHRRRRHGRAHRRRTRRVRTGATPRARRPHACGRRGRRRGHLELGGLPGRAACGRRVATGRRGGAARAHPARSRRAVRIASQPVGARRACRRARAGHPRGRPCAPSAIPAAGGALHHARHPRRRLRRPRREPLVPRRDRAGARSPRPRAHGRTRERGDDGAPRACRAARGRARCRAAAHTRHRAARAGVRRDAGVRAERPGERPQVFLGEDGRRDDALAYRAPAMAPGIRYNPVTAAAALPVLAALLPGAEPLRWSTPAPAGLPGGYPVRIADGSVALDLPPGVTLAAAISFNERMGRDDGVERVDDDGTVHFTARCREAVAGVAPDLAEPLAIGALQERAAGLDIPLVEPTRRRSASRGSGRLHPPCACRLRPRRAARRAARTRSARPARAPDARRVGRRDLGRDAPDRPCRAHPLTRREEGLARRHRRLGGDAPGGGETAGPLAVPRRRSSESAGSSTRRSTVSSSSAIVRNGISVVRSAPSSEMPAARRSRSI